MPDKATSTRTAIAAGAIATAGGEAGSQTLPPLGPKSTGVPGPGQYGGGGVEFSKTAVKGPETFDTFGCDVFRENPNTPDWTTANVYFERKSFLNGELKMP